MPEGSSRGNRTPMINPVSYQISSPVEFETFRMDQMDKATRAFCSASGLSNRDEESYVNTLLYMILWEVKVMINWRHLASQPTIQRNDVVKGKFDGYYVKRRNIILERAKFHRRKQETGEPVDSFIIDLKLHLH